MVTEGVNMKRSSFLRLVKGGMVTIQATDGKSFIANEKELFNVYLDSGFKSWGLDRIGESTPETNIQVFELIKDATFNQMFNSISNELDELCLTQSQIIEIVRNHKNLLNQKGYANFFLMKECGEYFVTHVFLYSGGELRAGVDRFDYADVWSGSLGHRVVSCKLQTL